MSILAPKRRHLRLTQAQAVFVVAIGFNLVLLACFFLLEWPASTGLFPNAVAAPATDFRTTKNLVMQKIEDIQNPSSCGDASYLLCKNADKCGFGCTMHKLAWCFTIALQLGRTLVPEEHFFRAPYLNFENPACQSNSSDVTCWFQPLSNCSTWVYQNQDNPDVKVDVQAYSWPHQQYRRRADLSKVADAGTFGDVDVSTERFTDEPRRLFWLQSMLIGYLLRPNDAVLDFIEDRRRTMNVNSSPFVSLGQSSQQDAQSKSLLEHVELKDGSSSASHIRQFYGVHIRRGDKEAEVKHREVSEYPEALRALVEKHSNLNLLPSSDTTLQSSTGMPHICSVFLATDDDEIVPDFVNFLHMNESAIGVDEGYCKQWEMLHTDSIPPTRGSWKATARVISDIDLLASSVGFVGTQSSNLGRLVFELMTFWNAHRSDSIEHRVFSLGGTFTIMHHEGVVESHAPYEHVFRT